MYLLDTCALLYLAAAPDRLSSVACELVCAKNNAIYCSVITVPELACLQERGKIHRECFDLISFEVDSLELFDFCEIHKFNVVF